MKVTGGGIIYAGGRHQKYLIILPVKQIRPYYDVDHDAYRFEIVNVPQSFKTFNVRAYKCGHTCRGISEKFCTGTKP